jgi:hypothetical protein
MKTMMIALLVGAMVGSTLTAGQPPDEPCITVRMCVTNPCDKAVSNAFYYFRLPDEVTKADVIDFGGLSMVTNEWAFGTNINVGRTVDLAPHERQVFGVRIRDVWFIPDERAMEIRRHYKETLLALDKLERAHGVREPDEHLRQLRQCQLADVAEYTDTVPNEVHTNYERHVVCCL